MKLDQGRLTYLFQRYLQNEATDNEMEELFGYIRKSEKEETLKEQMIEVFNQIQPEEDFDHIDWEVLFSKIVNRSEKKITGRPTGRRIRLWRNVAAAMLLMILGSGGIYFLMNHSPVPRQTDRMQAATAKIDILPGGNKAKLTLSNGVTITLDSATNGKLASQGNVNVVKLNNGLLAYHPKGKNDQPPEYNTLTTPRGGQYRITLADGTRVWLNAASSIRYPVAFTRKERRVEITGEAYFEVTPSTKPFVVHVNSSSNGGGLDVKVLGTHFNVNAYADEPVIKTTLLEGSVKVTTGNGQGAILKPGEQAILRQAQDDESKVRDDESKIKVVKNIDMDDVISWKNGFFSFRNDNLKAVMRKISRWYDVEVVYNPGVNNDQQFSGRIDRSLTLSQILSGLEQTRAHFRIEEGRKVVILP